VRFINLVDSVSKLNFGVWNAAVINANSLKNFGVETELWYPGEDPDSIADVTTIKIADTGYKTLDKLVAERRLEPDQDVIITSGMWRYPTKWGSYLNARGFQWILVPQGMLEPWPLRQKRIQKKLYFNLVEKYLARKANVIRAVSKPEAKNLAMIFPKSRIEYIPNGVKTDQVKDTKTPLTVLKRYLFLSRLHHKKNIISLAHAWITSDLNNNPLVELTIAGPDQGELAKLQTIISSSENIKYAGIVSGSAKDNLFADATFFILPSFSEGLPSSLLEAMSQGAIPIITEGCNCPDVFELELGVKITTEISSIRQALEDTAQWLPETINARAAKCRNLIVSEYSIEAVTKKQVEVYLSLRNDY
jgi:glycosyltransferase involved in cell wall biosynthesis